MEDLLIKTIADSPAFALAFYALFKINGTLGVISKSLDKLEQRIERLEAIILKEVTK